MRNTSSGKISNNQFENNSSTVSKLIIKLQLIVKKEDKYLWRIIRFTTTFLFFLNQLMSYSIAIEIDQGNIRKIEMNQKSSKLIGKIVDFIFGEDDVNN